MQTLRLVQSLTDENRVEAFEVAQDNQLLDRRMVANVALSVGMRIAPFLGRLPEESDSLTLSL